MITKIRCSQSQRVMNHFLFRIAVTVCIFNLLFLQGCTSQVVDDAIQPIDSELSTTAELKGGTYSDPFMHMRCDINHPDWVFDKNGYDDSVLFYNPKTESGYIIMVLGEVCRPADIQAQELWEIAREEYRDTVPDIDNVEQQSVFIGDSHHVFFYQFEVMENEKCCSMQYLYWNQGKWMYTCRVQAEMGHKDEIQDVLTGILYSFSPYGSRLESY